MKPHLIDLPVAINFYARPETLQPVFEQIRNARPSVLFLISDGPKVEGGNEAANVLKCRELVGNIDWDCEVHRLYNEVNKGLFVTYFESMKKVFEYVDYCVFLEDDVVVSQSFFTYEKELLERYKNDSRISFVTAINIHDRGVYEKCPNDYFFCGEGALTAYGLWRRTFESMNTEFISYAYDVNNAKDLARKLKPGYEKRISTMVSNPNYNGHIPHVEVYKNLTRFFHNQLCIVPRINMVSNIGVCSNATHSANDIRKLPRVTQRLFEAKRYEFVSELRHPNYVTCDIRYENEVNYILAWNRPLLHFVRKIEALIRHLVFGDFYRVKEKIVQFARGQNHD